jgi:hypothetical protein
MSDCTSTIVVSPDTLYPTSSNSAALKTLSNTEEAPDVPPADEGDTQRAYSSDLLYSPNIGAVTKNYP